MADLNEPRLAYSIEEAGALLGLKKHAARMAAYKGTLPTVKVGGRRFVTRAALERLLTGEGQDAERAKDSPSGNRLTEEV